MREPKSKRQRLIGLLYWAVWGWCALAVGFCAATATWIVRLHVVSLTLLGLPLTLACGLLSFVLLMRSDAAPKRRGLRAAFWTAGIALIAGSATFVVWTLFDEARSLAGWWMVELERLNSDLYEWGSKFTLYQLAVFIISFAFVVLVGWLTKLMFGALAQRLGAGRQPVALSMRQLVLVLALSILMLPVLLFGGYEQCRRAGMAIIVASFEGSLSEVVDEARKQGPSLLKDVRDKSQGSESHIPADPHLSLSPWRCLPVSTVHWNPKTRMYELPLVGGGGQTPGYHSISPGIIRRRAILTPMSEAEVATAQEYHHLLKRSGEQWPADYWFYQLRYRNYPVRCVYDQWYEQGPSLTFGLPW